MSESQAPKILVIEDETTQRILAKDYLEESGYIVRLADDGLRGLEMASLLQPDLIILDLLLPSIDGYTLCSRLKQNAATAGIPVILVTASREPDVIERGLAVGASDFVTKPVDWNYLADRVALVLQQTARWQRLNADKQASEQKLLALMKAGHQPAEPAVESGATQTDESRDDVEKEIQAVQNEADERIRKIVAEAQDIIRSEQEACRVQTENAARQMDSTAQSFWSLIAASTEPHVALLTSLNQLTTGATADNAGETQTLPVANHRKNAVQSLLSSTRNMQLLSHHMMGTVELAERPLDLTTLIADAVAEVRPESEHRRLSVVFDSPNEPMQITADEQRVRYVVLSMIMNAFRFCPANGTIRIGLTSSENEPVRMTIEDNGVGIAPAQVEALRQCAIHPAGVLCDPNGQPGFGVPISTAMMKLHGGALAIESKVGEGTTVTLDFPAERKCPAQQEATSTEQQHAASVA